MQDTEIFHVFGPCPCVYSFANQGQHFMHPLKWALAHKRLCHDKIVSVQSSTLLFLLQQTIMTTGLECVVLVSARYGWKGVEIFSKYVCISV